MIESDSFEAADKITKLVFKEWGKQTLEDLRVEASKEETGLKYVTIRVDRGMRFILIVCAAKPEPINALSRMFKFPQSAEGRKNWLEYSLVDFALDTLKGSLLAYQDANDERDGLAAIALCVIRQDVVKLLEDALTLPP